MTRFFLIRHALCDPVGRAIAGRAPGVHLNAQGRDQAERLAERLAEVRLAAVYSSPLERSLETAEPLAARRGLRAEPVPALTEIDFGEWTGRTLAELAEAAGWREFNGFRSCSRIPGGELMLEVQARTVGALDRLARRHPDAAVAVVTHGDVVRAALAHFLGTPLDLLLRLEVSPGSVSVVELGAHGARVLLVNATERWPLD